MRLQQSVLVIWKALCVFGTKCSLGSHCVSAGGETVDGNFIPFFLGI